jgi:hypothetical protein
MKNHFKKKETKQNQQKPRIRSAAYRWAVERLEEAVMQAREIKSDRLCELEYMQQIEAIENVRRRLFGPAFTPEPKRFGKD